MRQKYIDERHPCLMSFGRTMREGLPVVTDVNDTINVVMRNDEDADAFVNHYNKLHEAYSRCIVAFAEADHDAFVKFWYGSEL